MEELRTQVFSTFSEEEEAHLKKFKEEIFYIVGRHIPDALFWQELFNLLFIYHYDLGGGETFATRRDMRPAELMIYSPSLFFLRRGVLFPTGEKVHWKSDEDESVSWYSGRDYLLSFFYREGDTISLVDSKIAEMFERKHSKFLSKINLLMKSDNFSEMKSIEVLFLMALLLLKKDRYQDSPLYDSFKIEEFEKLQLYYAKLSKHLI
ncbi:hypothetical protein KAH37_05735 [bacterium]|nr:hypothetical protein [bacterium]